MTHTLTKQQVTSSVFEYVDRCINLYELTSNEWYNNKAMELLIKVDKLIDSDCGYYIS